jgi:hypothetical protein
MDAVTGKYSGTTVRRKWWEAGKDPPNFISLGSNFLLKKNKRDRIITKEIIYNCVLLQKKYVCICIMTFKFHLWENTPHGSLLIILLLMQ